MGDEAVVAQVAPSTMGEVLDLLAPGQRVLDLGGGKGSFRYDDYSPLEIAALDEYPEASAPPFPAHVRYRQGTAERLPYPDAHFDLVITNFVLEHVQDFPRAVEEIARVVKPQGYFY